MPLEKHLVPVVFNKGVDTKSNNKVASSNDTLVDLRNAVFTTTERVTKRNGYTALTAGILGGGTINAGAALALRGTELLLADGSNLYAYSAAGTLWRNKGPIQSATVTTAPLLASGYSLAGYDCTVNTSGLVCACAEQWLPVVGITGAAVSGVVWSITDAAGGALYAPTVIASATAPKVIAGASNFLLFYILSGVIRCTTIPYSNPSGTTDVAVTYGAAVTNTSLGANGTNYDAVLFNSKLYIAFSNSQPPNGLTTFQSTESAPGTIANQASVATGGNACAFNVFGNRFNNDVVVGYIEGGAAKFVVYNSTLTLTTNPVATLAAGFFTSITGVSLSASATSLTFYFGGADGVAPPYAAGGVASCEVIGPYAVSAAYNFAYGVSLAGKAFVSGVVPYVPLSFWTGATGGALTIGLHYSAPQGTWVLATGAAAGLPAIRFQMVAKAWTGTFSGFYMNNNWVTLGLGQMLPESTAYGASFICATGSAATLTPQYNSYFAQRIATSYTKVTLSDATNGYVSTQLAGTTIFSGGMVSSYDGRQGPPGLSSAIEHGFLYGPWGLSQTSAAGALTGTYSYIAVYEWTDRNGIVHRSTPSPALSVTLAAQKPTIKIPTLRLTLKTSTPLATNTTDVKITLYRTLANGTVYYQINNTAVGGTDLSNRTDYSTLTYTDNLADSAVSANSQLYTTGGVLQNYAPNPLASVVTHRNRVWGIDTTSPLSLWFSKQVIQSTNVAAGSPVEFSAFLTFNVDPKGGPCTALASLDDKLIIFKADRIFGVTGQGPDSTGGQNDLSDAQLVTGDTGCTAPKSITNVPNGIMFQGQKGIYLLDRGLNCVYIGAPVETFTTGQTVCGAVLIPTTNQVRFSLYGTSTILVYDYFVGQWSRFYMMGGLQFSAGDVIWNGAHAWLTSVGRVFGETAGQVGDVKDAVNTYVNMYLQTSWLSLAGFQGFKRVRRLLVDGTAVLANGATTAQMRIAVGFNYSDNAPTLFTVSVFDAITNANSNGSFQERMHLAIQKCESIRVSIEDIGNPSSYFDVTGITLEVAAKRGAFKLPAAASTS